MRRALDAQWDRFRSQFRAQSLLGLLLIGVVVGGLAVLLPPDAPEPTAGLYRVEVLPGTPSILQEAVRLSPELDAVPAGSDADLRLGFAEITIRNGARGESAYESLVAQLDVLQADRLADLPDGIGQPVRVQLVQVPRTTLGEPAQDEDGAATDPTTPESESAGGGGGAEPQGPQEAPTNATTPFEGSDQDAFEDPANISPPFPLRPLLLTFAYILPTSLLMQSLAANLQREKQRGLARLLLQSPNGPGSILLAILQPYVLGCLLIAGVVTGVLGAGLLGGLAALVFVGVLLASTTFLAVLAENQRELSLLLVASTTLLNLFLFLPALFPEVPPVAYLSPVHVVATAIQGGTIPFLSFLYATVPLLGCQVALFAMARGLFVEDQLFQRRSMRRRLPAGIAEVVTTKPRLLLAGVLLVPFVFAAQLVTFAMVAVAGLEIAFLIWLPLGVVVEEVAKYLVLRGGKRPVAWGLLVGVGFFLAEKGSLILTLLGFADLPYGQQALTLLGSGAGLPLLLAPLLLHASTCVVLQAFVNRGRGGWGLVVATLVHYGYNQVVIQFA